VSRYIHVIVGAALAAVPLNIALVGAGSAQSLDSFAVIAGQTLTNTGPTTIVGNIAVSPGSSYTGSGSVTQTGQTFLADAVAIGIQSSLTTLYNELAGRPTSGGGDLTGQDLAGMTLTSGVYNFDSSAGLAGGGILTLDGGGDPDAVFVFNIDTTLIAGSGSQVVLINGAQGGNVYYRVGSSATLDTAAQLTGQILAQQSITLNTAATLGCGAAYALIGAVTMDSNIIQICVLDDGSGGGPVIPPTVYLPSAPVYEALPLALLGMHGMSSLQQRVGNRQWATAAAPAAPVYVFCKDPAQNFRCLVTDEQALSYADGVAGAAIIEGSGAWMRLEGSRSELMPVSSTTGIEIEQVVGTVEVGIDLLLSQNNAGDRLVGGVSLRYSQSSTSVASAFGAGEIDTTGYGLGASLTWYQMNGLYVDGQAWAMWTQSDLSSGVLGYLADDVEGFGYGFSVEVGKEFALNNSWNITPQAQLSYVNVGADDFAGPFASVTDVKGESLALRLGLVFSREASWQADDGTTSRTAVNLGAHVIQEFRPESTVIVRGTTLTTEREDLMGEITLGGSYNWIDDKYSAYGQLSASTGLDNFGNSTRVGATLGLRIQW